MRKTVFALLCIALGAGFGSAAFAAQGDVTSTITRLYFYDGHTGLLVILDNMSDLGGCGNANWFILPKTNVNYKEIVALLMSAQAQGKQVNFTVSGCHEGYGSIRHAMLLN
jgi:hypothetical protein